MQGSRKRHWRPASGSLLLVSAIVMAHPALARGADELLIVDCLLPGKVQRLGAAATYVTARRAIKTSAADCGIRGGEFTASDRATYASSMRIWLPLAKSGDPEAQTNLGEILEKGLGGAPQPDLAVQWYQLAAEKGYARAQVNLGSMYERGLGVPKNMPKAMEWYRLASGLNSADVAFAPLEEVTRLREELEAERRERERLQIELEAVRTKLGGERSSLQRRQEELEAARRDLAAREQTIELQRQRADAEIGRGRDRADAEREIAELQRQLAAQRSVVAGRDSQLRLMQESVARLEVRSGKLQVQLAKAEDRRVAEVSAARAEAESARGQLIELAMQLSKANAVLNSRLALIGEQRAEVQRLRQELSSQQDNVSRKTADRIRLETQLKERQAELVESRNRLTSLNAEIARLDREAKAVRQSERAPGAATTKVLPEGVNFGRYHALIIGNNEHRYIPVLRTAVNDAKVVEDVLRRRYGFKTTLLLNADRYQLLSALNKLREQLTSEDNLLIYYAGHGELDRVNKRGYWLPVDAEANSTANWISSLQITDVMNAMAAKQILLVADSCYSGMLTRSSIARLDAGMTEEERTRWLKTMASKHARVVLTSGGVQPVLDGGGGSHSVFAAAFIAALDANSEVLEGQKLAQAVTQRVAVSVEAADIDQVPMYAPISFAGHEAGDFFFVPIR
jgi:TPR repeat protein